MKTVAICGLGFVGCRAFRELSGDKNIKLVAIDSKDYFENTPSSVECIADPTTVKKHLMNYTGNSALKKDGVFKQGLITGIASNGTTGEVTLANGEKIAFDYAILGTGSSYSQVKAPLTSQTTIPDRLAALQSQQQAISTSDSIVVVGAGPVGVEIAAAVAETFPGKKVTLICSGERILEAFATKVTEIATAWLVEKGVSIIYNERVTDWGITNHSTDTTTDDSVVQGTVGTDKGTSLTGLIFKCLGGKPNTAAFAASSPCLKFSPSGAILVESTLQVQGMPNIFAAGDVSSTTEEKTANYADYAGMVVAANVKMLAQGKEQKDLIKFPAGMFKGQEKLPFASGATLGKSNGVMQLGESDIQSGAAVGYMRSFFGKMIMGSVRGSWIWGPMYKGVKMMLAGQLAGLAKKASETAAAVPSNA